MTSDIRFFSNRASKLYAQAMQDFGGQVFEEGRDSQLDFLYFDAYGGKKPPQHERLGFSLMDRRLTIPLDNKLTMARELALADVSMPRTYFDIESVPLGSDKVWYIKKPMSTGGKGIQVCKSNELTEHFEQGDIIQESVDDLALIDGRKFTLRYYVLVLNNKIYMYVDGINIVHSKLYDKDDLSAENQYEHTGYQLADSDVKMSPFSQYAHYVEAMVKLAPFSKNIFKAFKSTLFEAKPDTYCLFGIDVLIDSQIDPVLIEINDRPNLVHTHHINQEVNVPLIRSMLELMFPERLDNKPLKRGFIELS